MMRRKGSAPADCISHHFADTFLEAQKLVTNEGDKSGILKCSSPALDYNTSIASVVSPSSPLCIFNGACNIFDGAPGSKEQYQAKFGSDRYLTKTYHLQNVASDSQPSISGSVSDHSSISRNSRNSEPPVSFTNPRNTKRGSTLPAQSTAPTKSNIRNMEDSKGKSLSKHQTLAMSSSKRKSFFSKDIRRTQSEATMNKSNSKSPKPSGGGSFGSLKRALSPFIFRKKKNTKSDEETMTGEVMRKVNDRSDSVHSVPIVMETGFPATSCSDINRSQEEAIMNSSDRVRGLVSPLVHPRNTINLPRGYSTQHQESGTLRGESKLTRKRAILSHGESPRSSKTSQSNSPAPSLDSVKQSNVLQNSVKARVGTPDRRDSSPVSVSSGNIKPRSTTPGLDKVKRGSLSHSPTRGNPLTVNFSGDISHAKETLVKPKAIKAYKNPTFTPAKRCSECNTPLSGVLVNRPDPPTEYKISNKTPNITVDTSDSELDRTLVGEGEEVVEKRHLLRTEMQDLLKRYSPPKQGIQGTATLQRKLKEIKKELEDYNPTTQDSQKIGEIRDKRNSDIMR